jgi:isopentenyl diphosphate isomerase/L-lactate dehydrogenase-like FMN-dependent dehydrogenase
MAKDRAMNDYFNNNPPDVSDFTFLGRPFVYGVDTQASKAGIHTINSLTLQLTQIMNQLGCKKVADLHNHLVK